MAQLARQGAHWRTQASACPRAGGCIVAGTWLYRGRGPDRVVACMAVSQAPYRPCRRAARPALPACDRAARLCAYAQRLCRVAGIMKGRVAGAAAVLQYSPAHFPLLPCHNTPGCIAIQPCLLQPFSRNTVNCIAIQFTAYPASPPIAIQFVPSQPPLQSQYRNCIAIQSYLHPTSNCHDTLDCIAIQSSIPLAASVTVQYLVLRYNFLPSQLHTLAIQSAVLQYNSQPSLAAHCNTILCFTTYPFPQPSLQYCHNTTNCIVTFSSNSQPALLNHHIATQCNPIAIQPKHLHPFAVD